MDIKLYIKKLMDVMNMAINMGLNVKMTGVVSRDISEALFYSQKTYLNQLF